MKYLAPLAIVLCTTIANAETHSTSTAGSDTALSNSAQIQKTTQSVAQKLITILGLKTVSDNQKASISLKTVVVKALSEGKQMSEIRLATTQAIKEVTGKTLEMKPVTASAAATTSTLSAVTQQPVSEAQAQVVTTGANPAETTFDSETGKMVATVLPGESIFRMAQRVYGKENGRKYLEIYAANRDKIKNINVVVEGQVLVMP